MLSETGTVVSCTVEHSVCNSGLRTMANPIEFLVAFRAGSRLNRVNGCGEQSQPLQFTVCTIQTNICNSDTLAHKVGALHTVHQL